MVKIKKEELNKEELNSLLNIKKEFKKLKLKNIDFFFRSI
jgi:hypothetical protein